MSEWRDCTLGELVEMSSGGTPRMDNPTYWNGDIPWISSSSLTSLRLSQSARMVTSAAIGNGTKIARAGSVLIVVRGMSLRTEIRVGKAARDVAFNQDVKALRVLDDADPDFILYMLDGREDELLGMVRSATNGTGVLPTDLLTGLPIALPPLDEQRRIVAIMAAVDAQIEALEAEVVAERDMLTRLRAVSFGALADRLTVRADDLFEMLLGRQKSERQSVGDHVIPYLRAGNISDRALKLDDVLTMNFDLREQEKYALRSGDVVISEGGTPGNAALWSGQLPGPIGFDKHVIRLRPQAGFSTSAYALHWAHWTRESGVFDATATGITIKALGFGRASAMPVPSIDIHEQDTLTAPLESVAESNDSLSAELASLRTVRSGVLTALLSHEISADEAVDQFLTEEAA